ncbi:MAG TPA: hypothetical protein VJ840_14545 [Gemmatimonadaceae bacterium]|nr:hypothetical protein [Gemmatimonadaceae bacterium]
MNRDAIGSTVVYTGLLILVLGVIVLVKPVRIDVTSRNQAVVILLIGAVATVIGLRVPPTESRIASPRNRLDHFVPTWQFGERHSLRIDAPQPRVFAALRQVTAHEIRFFRLLTWLRRGGRSAPQSILNAGSIDTPIIDVALKGGFVMLSDDSARELVVGTIIGAPARAHCNPNGAMFESPPPGYTLAAMNFLVERAAANTCVLTTETRVYANTPDQRRRFTRYWRLIYPGSALIRRMWLRAVRNRATRPVAQ